MSIFTQINISEPVKANPKNIRKNRMVPNSIASIILTDYEVHECHLQKKINTSHKHSQARYNIQTCLKSLDLIYGLDAMIIGVYSSITINN